MYKVELSTETVDMIFRDIFVEDYIRICRDIDDLKNRKDALACYEKEDLENNEEYRKGFEILLKYYLPLDEAVEIMKDMK
jgi:hypothetical protein